MLGIADQGKGLKLHQCGECACVYQFHERHDTRREMVADFADFKSADFYHACPNCGHESSFGVCWTQEFQDVMTGARP
jgi:hypothetical protein